MQKNVIRFLFFAFIIFIFLPLTPILASEPAAAKKQPSLEEAVAVLESDEDHLRHIAKTIFNRKASSTFLATKTCTHGSEICTLWQHHRWKSMGAEERRVLKQQIEQMRGAKLPDDLSTDDVVSILRRSRFSEFAAEASPHYMTLGNQAIKEGSIAIDCTPDTRRCGIKVLFKFPRPIGRTLILQEPEGAADSGGAPSFTSMPTSTLMVTFDIQDIVEKMVRKEKFDPANDGRVTTLCPTEDSEAEM